MSTATELTPVLGGQLPTEKALGMAVSSETFRPKPASAEQARAAGKDIAELRPVSSVTLLSLDRRADTESETADRPHSSPDGKLLRTCGTGPELIQVLK